MPPRDAIGSRFSDRDRIERAIIDPGRFCERKVGDDWHELLTHWQARAVILAFAQLAAERDKIAEQPSQEGVQRAREDAMATALCLLDTFAGEEMTHVYGNGQELCSTDVCIALARAFGVELEAGWYRKVATVCATPKPADPTSDERTAYAALHTVQHEGANIVKPVAGGNIVAWAASEIRALRERTPADPTSEAVERVAREVLERIQWAHERTYKEDIAALLREALACQQPLAHVRRATAALATNAPEKVKG
jgi:hypothetical protein